MVLTSALRWCFVGAFAGGGLIALAACPLSHSGPGTARQPPYRPLEARTYGSAYAPWSKANARPDASAGGQGFREIVRLLRSNAPEELRARAALRLGNARYARKLLESVTSRGNASAAAWSDYSAVLQAEAAADDAFTLTAALAAADHALDIDPTLLEALFNRALVLETMSLRGPAATAYAKYLEADRSSPWSAEVQSRIEKLELSARTAEKSQRAIARMAQSDDELLINDTAIAFPEDSRRWAEGACLADWGHRILEHDAAGAARMLNRCRIIGRALEAQAGDSFLADTVRAIDTSANPTGLARAHVAYARGRRAFAQMNLASALTALEEARWRFAANDSPMALPAQAFLATLSLNAGSAGRAASILVDVSRHTPERYSALRAQIQWLEGLSATIGGKNGDALKLYRSASAAFSALGEKQNAARTRELATALLAATGRTAEAWRSRGEILGWSNESGDDTQLSFTLYGAARDAIVDGRWDIAHALLNTILETTTHFEHMRDEVLTWRIVAAHRACMFRTAAAELQAARDARHRPDDLMLVEALVTKFPGKALSLMDEELNAAEQQGDESAISQLLVQRALLLRTTGQSFRAHGDLQRAVALLERHPSRRSKMTLRDAVLGTPDRAYRLLADSLDARGITEGVMDALDLYKLRINNTRSPSSEQIHISCHDSPPGTLLITYGVFDNRLVIYANSSVGSTRTAIPVQRAQIELLVSAFDQAIARGDPSAFQNASRALEQILVQPIADQVMAADTLVFVRDPAFGNLPFGALVGSNKHFLVEQHAVVVTPSISSYLRASNASTGPLRALLSVGNPTAGKRSDPLPELAAAKSEAEDIAAMYPSHALLVEGDATKARVIGSLPYCDAAHFAVHANAGMGDAMPAHLILSRTPDSEGILTAPEIAELPLDRLRVVVLAGCSTAISSTRSRTDSLVSAFLAAGARSVIGTLWPVEDAPTRTMSIALHRELREGAAPAQALRAAQLEMIRRGATPRVWASLQLYGSGR